MQEQKEIYVIGAGISGLIAAYELEKAGFHPVVLEQAGSFGGRVQTIQEKGFALDVGFQVLLSAYPMARKYLDMEKLDLTYLESGALIYADGKSYLIGDPLRNWKVLIPTLLADIGSVGDKLKILKLNLSLKRKSLEAIFKSSEKTTLEYLQDFGFSQKIIHRFFKPFFSGIFLEPDLRTSSRMFEFVYKMFGEGYATIPKGGIGAISHQLRSKLVHTKFVFNCPVEEVNSDCIVLGSGEKKTYDGVVVASSNSSLVSKQKGEGVAWKSCMCLYFEVDRTNIPDNTIALVTKTGQYINNLYAYTDGQTGKKILSVTTLKHKGKTDEEVIGAVIGEVKNYTGATGVEYIQHYRIDQALPDIKDLKRTSDEGASEVLDGVFVAGDYLFNGSLNAAMESGRLAAEDLIRKSN